MWKIPKFIFLGCQLILIFLVFTDTDVLPIWFHEGIIWVIHFHPAMYHIRKDPGILSQPLFIGLLPQCLLQNFTIPGLDLIIILVLVYYNLSLKLPKFAISLIWYIIWFLICLSQCFIDTIDLFQIYLHSIFQEYVTFGTTSYFPSSCPSAILSTSSAFFLPKLPVSGSLCLFYTLNVLQGHEYSLPPFPSGPAHSWGS